MKRSTHILSAEVNKPSQIEHNCITSTQIKEQKILTTCQKTLGTVLSCYTPKVNVSDF